MRVKKDVKKERLIAMLKTILESKKTSVYAASKSSGIPYTTLNELVNGKKRIADCNIKTIYALASFLGMSTDSLYALLTEQNRVEKIATTWEDKRNKKFRFPIKEASDLYDASRVHPLKQRLVSQVAHELKNDKKVKSVFLFGSATTIRCNKESDIDLAIELQEGSIDTDAKNEISEKIQEMCLWHVDIIWMDHVEEGSKLQANIKKGLQIV